MSYYTLFRHDNGTVNITIRSKNLSLLLQRYNYRVVVDYFQVKK